jgi:hypothetical protein
VDHLCLDGMDIKDGPAKIRNAERKYTAGKYQGTLHYVEVVTKQHRICIYNDGTWHAYNLPENVHPLAPADTQTPDANGNS